MATENKTTDGKAVTITKEVSVEPTEDTETDTPSSIDLSAEDVSFTLPEAIKLPEKGNATVDFEVVSTDADGNAKEVRILSMANTPTVEVEEETGLTDLTGRGVNPLSTVIDAAMAESE